MNSEFIELLESIAMNGNKELCKAIVEGLCICHPAILTESRTFNRRLGKLAAALGVAGAAYLGHPIDRYMAHDTADRYNKATEMVAQGADELNKNNCKFSNLQKDSAPLENHDGFYTHYSIPQKMLNRLSKNGLEKATSKMNACNDASMKFAEGNAELDDIYENNYQDLENSRTKYN